MRSPSSYVGDEDLCKEPTSFAIVRSGRMSNNISGRRRSIGPIRNNRRMIGWEDCIAFLRTERTQ